MIHASWVWVAWVAWAMPGSATFSDDIAATTAASARHTTAVTAPGRAAPAARGFTGERVALVIVASSVRIYDLERHYISLERQSRA